MLLKKLHKLYDIICCIIVLLFSANADKFLIRGGINEFYKQGGV